MLVFWDPTDLGLVQGFFHHINTGDSKPVKMQPYRQSFAEKAEIDKQVGPMEACGVVQPSASPFAAAVVLARKKNGKWRFCVDFRGLNKVTVPDNYPLPRIDAIFDQLGNSRYFTMLDAQSGYWQIPMAPEDVHKTAFITHRGLREFVRMPFGLTGAPATYQRVMDITLNDEIHGPDPVATQYLEDTCVHTEAWDQHLEALDAILTKLAAINLKLCPTKCLFGASISDTLSARTSFCQTLKSDYSTDGIGAALSQLDDDGKEHPIAFAYRSLRGAEVNYSTTDGELLAMVWAITVKFRPYLYGGPTFTCRVDHNSLIYLHQQRNLTGRLARWHMKLMEYNFTVVHRAGRICSNVDPLSRHPLHDPPEEDWDDLPAYASFPSADLPTGEAPTVLNITRSRQRATAPPPFERRECFNCSRPGHFSPVCPTRAQRLNTAALPEVNMILADDLAPDWMPSFETACAAPPLPEWEPDVIPLDVFSTYQPNFGGELVEAAPTVNYCEPNTDCDRARDVSELQGDRGVPTIRYEDWARQHPSVPYDEKEPSPEPATVLNAAVAIPYRLWAAQHPDFALQKHAKVPDAAPDAAPQKAAPEGAEQPLPTEPTTDVLKAPTAASPEPLREPTEATAEQPDPDEETEACLALAALAADEQPHPQPQHQPLSAQPPETINIAEKRNLTETEGDQPELPTKRLALEDRTALAVTSSPEAEPPSPAEPSLALTSASSEPIEQEPDLRLDEVKLLDTQLGWIIFEICQAHEEAKKLLPAPPAFPDFHALTEAKMADWSRAARFHRNGGDDSLVRAATLSERVALTLVQQDPNLTAADVLERVKSTVQHLRQGLQKEIELSKNVRAEPTEAAVVPLPTPELDNPPPFDLASFPTPDPLEYVIGDPDVAYYFKTGCLPAFHGEPVERRKDLRRQIRDRSKMYHMAGERLYWLASPKAHPNQPPPPSVIRRPVLTKPEADSAMYHLHNQNGHPNVKQTRKLIADRFYWNGMSKDITDHVVACPLCLLANQPTTERSDNGTLVPTERDLPREKVGLDLLGPFPPTKEGYRYVALLEDYHTHYVLGGLLRSNDTDEVAEYLRRELFSHHGSPAVITMDNALSVGTVKSLCQEKGSYIQPLPAYSPWINGLAESVVKHFKRGLRKLQARYGDDWPRYFYDLLFAHRICVRGATLFSAFHMVYGRHPILPVERLFAQRYRTMLIATDEEVDDVTSRCLEDIV
ncbi:hypothetical protein KFL_010100030, partial [Klebsormidium nitens]